MKESKLKRLEPSSTEELSCKILHARLNCQRKPNEYDVRELATNFIPKRCDPIDVSFRDNCYGIIEGQKRVLAKLMLDPDATIVCRVYRGLSEEDENRLFSEINNGKRTYGSSEDYLARESFDQKWKYCIKLLKDSGFNIAYGGGAKFNTFCCPATLEEIYDELGDINFVGVLQLLKLVCGGNKNSLQATFIKGFSKFYILYKTSIIENELKKVFINKKTKELDESQFDEIKNKSKTCILTKNVGTVTAFGILLRYNECCISKNRLSLGTFDTLFS